MTSSEQFHANRKALLDLIATLSFRLGDFKLASGQRSDYYIDCRVTTLHAEGGRLAGLVLLDLIRRYVAGAEAVGGLTMGADPLVTATSTASAWTGSDLVHGFLVRKAEKAHGTGRKVEGFLKAGAKVVIVDDVCTTGGSTITAIEAARGAGMDVIGVFCLVDREQGGRAKIEEAAKGAPFVAAFTANDVRAAHLALKAKG